MEQLTNIINQVSHLPQFVEKTDVDKKVGFVPPEADTKGNLYVCFYICIYIYIYMYVY